MIKVLSAWKAVRSEATITGHEVLGEDCCNDSAWKAVHLWRCIKCMSFGVVPSRHIVPAPPFRALRTRLSSLRSVVPSRHLTLNATNCNTLASLTMPKEHGVFIYKNPRKSRTFPGICFYFLFISR